MTRSPSLFHRLVDAESGGVHKADLGAAAERRIDR
jgi:hypothetical protein